MSELNSIEHQIQRVSDRIKKMFPDFVGKPSGYYKTVSRFVYGEINKNWYECFADTICYYNHYENAFWSTGGNYPTIPEKIGECVLEVDISKSNVLANSTVYTHDEWVNRWK